MISKLKKKFNKHYWLRKFYTTSFASMIFNKNKLREKVFNAIYKSKHWVQPNINLKKEQFSVSGHGSYLGTKQTENLISNLNNFINQFQIKSIIDVPCGDFLWMNKVISQNNNIKYLGLDIVSDLISENITNYKNTNINFKALDIFEEVKIFEDNIDLFFTRDFFIHCENNDIIKLIKKLKKSNFKYFACESYKIKKNTEVQTGKHRKVNLLIEPYNLPNPVFEFQDHEQDKFICFFEIRKLLNIK